MQTNADFAIAIEKFYRKNGGTNGALLAGANWNNNQFKLNGNNPDNQNENLRCRALAKVYE